jgi:lipoprotein NlpI
MDPKSAEAHNNLGLVLLDANSPQAAAQEFRRCVELQPGYAAAHYNLGLAMQRAGDNHVAEAEFQKARRLGLEIPPVN